MTTNLQDNSAEADTREGSSNIVHQTHIFGLNEHFRVTSRTLVILPREVTFAPNSNKGGITFDLADLITLLPSSQVEIW
jgi:hypothetical protein